MPANPDGEGEQGYFRLESLALAPGTVIELRNLRFTNDLVAVKPDFEGPITWPVKAVNPDGSVTYTLTC